LVQARDAVPERGGCAAAGAEPDDGAGDCGRPWGVAGKAAQATRKQSKDLQAAILAALRKRDGAIVIDDGAPGRWQLKREAYSA
jgi:hypothetical protein